MVVMLFSIPYISAAAIAVFVMLRTFLKLTKEEPNALTFFFLRLGCLAVMLISWFCNVGFLRIVLSIFYFPLIHAILFCVPNGFSMRKLSRSKALKYLIIASYVTYAAAYILLPDNGSFDSNDLEFLFDIAHSPQAADTYFLLSKILFALNFIISLVQIGVLAKLKDEDFISFYRYIRADGAKLFTVCCLPDNEKKFPTVIFRSPYVDDTENMIGTEIFQKYIDDHKNLLEAGYAVVFQHCRGRGKSSGDCVPYIYEREDGLLLQDWVRNQPFYNGEIYLVGGSYTTSVHYVTAPFAEDIKGAVLEIQDTERYNCNYRNGFYKIGLHGCWYPTMYKKKDPRGNSYKLESFDILPLTDFSEAVFGEKIPSFDEIFLHPDKNDDFWNTHFGGAETRGVLNHANIPILLVTGFYDIYTGGIFDMWNALDEETKAQSALLVHPYDHGNDPTDEPIEFENGSTYAIFGNHVLRWLEHVRRGETPPITPGKVTYHTLFSGMWQADDFSESGNYLTYRLGEGEYTYTYDPTDPAYFKGGLSTNFGGCEWQDAPGTRQDILTFYTPEFTEDTSVKGKIKVKLAVRSDCEDTCFYVRLSLVKKEGDYGLRDDINQISNFAPEYLPGEVASMEFSFDEHAFVASKGEKIRIDVSSSAYPHYVRHTNNRGLFSLQTTTKIAKNTVIADKSEIVIPVEGI